MVTLQEIEPCQRHSSTVMQPSSEDMDLEEPKKDDRKVQSTSLGYAPPHPANHSWEEIEPSQRHSSAVPQPSSEYMGLKEPREDNRKAQSTSPVYEPLHPAKRSWEVPRHHVTIEKVIGKGSFGQVAKGTAVGLQGRPDTTTVAIKMLKCESSIDFSIFLTLLFFFLVCFAYYKYLHIINIYSLQLTLLNRTREIWWKNLKRWRSLKNILTLSNFWDALQNPVCFGCVGFIVPYAFSL